MRIYVAGSQHDWPRARHVMDELTRRGHVISHDWTCEVEDHATTPATPEELIHYAKLDLAGVQTAHIVLCLTPERKDWGRGLWTEMGIGLALNKRVIVTGPGRDWNIFASLCERYSTDEEGIGACG